jgi:hypothetical protein
MTTDDQTLTTFLNSASFAKLIKAVNPSARISGM